MKKLERIVLYSLILLQLITLLGFYLYLRDDIQIADGNIKRIIAEEVIIKNDENEIVAMIGKVDENGHVSVRDRYGRLITLMGVDETDIDIESKARIVVADHYEDYSIGKYYGVNGEMQEEIYEME